MIELTKRMSDFGNNFSSFGQSLVKVLIVISILLFWTLIFIFYEPYQEIAVMILKILQLGIIIVLSGRIIHYLFYFINELVVKYKMNGIKLKVGGKK